MMRVIGMDIHRTFAETVMIDGDRLIRLGRIKMSRDHLAAFAAKLTSEDHLVIEATGNAHAVVEAVAPFVGRVIIAPTAARETSPDCAPECPHFWRSRVAL
jgi:hypothetical protein